jgi:hypothetical protein
MLGGAAADAAVTGARAQADAAHQAARRADDWARCKIQLALDAVEQAAAGDTSSVEARRQLTVARAREGRVREPPPGRGATRRRAA